MPDRTRLKFDTVLIGTSFKQTTQYNTNVYSINNKSEDTMFFTGPRVKSTSVDRITWDNWLDVEEWKYEILSSPKPRWRI